jgi:CRISPR-associated exonuclease Cas4
MTYAEDDLIMISALQHYAFCERQCALIHIEQIWDENRATAEGRIMHERVHEQDRESRGEVRIEFGLPLRSLKLGLVGRADVVEFHRLEKNQWQPFPVEYKRGKPKVDHCDLIQLCAQALCLEERTGHTIDEGMIFYWRSRRRMRVLITPELRAHTEATVQRAFDLLEAGVLPPPTDVKARCHDCSLEPICLPHEVQILRGSAKVRRRSPQEQDA